VGHAPHSSLPLQPSAIEPQYCPPAGVQVTGVQVGAMPVSRRMTSSGPSDSGEPPTIASFAADASRRTSPKEAFSQETKAAVIIDKPIRAPNFDTRAIQC
jgi:hypothetical protein